ncbi:MAG: hypothetical protein ACUVQZ_03370 [Candidatus Caldatribacteriaceae bacterium]
MKFIEELLEEAENLLDAVLGKEEKRPENDEHCIEEGNQEELLELFVEVLLSLKGKEDNALKAPRSRWKAFQSPLFLDWEKITLSDLLSLYHVYLRNDSREKEFSIDNSFEKLLIERRERVQIMIYTAQGKPLEMNFFFQDCRDPRSTIATFLVLLDLVFRKELRMIIENPGKVYFEKNGKNEIFEKSS